VELHLRVSQDSKMVAKGMPPKVKSWRDAGDTPYRKNHQEEAKNFDSSTPPVCA
jgi:hypothetical protein